MIDTNTVIETVYYLLKRLGPKTKMEILKLVFMADKYHLIQYGRTITGDEYLAMQYGPVGSTVKDVLDFRDFVLSSTELKLAAKYIEESGSNDRKAREDGPDIDQLDMLSETDIEALDYAIEKFGSWSAYKLSQFTHQYPEWERFKPFFEKGSTKRERIKIEELLTTISNDGIEATDEHLEEVQKLVTGYSE